MCYNVVDIGYGQKASVQEVCVVDQPRYQEIALEIAHSIVMGEYREGERIHGRSTLAGRFNVSPETIRRAIALLQNAGIVDVSQGVGITVCSKALAERFLRAFDQKNEVHALLNEIKQLLEKRNEIDQQIENRFNSLLSYVDRLLTRWMDVAEIEVGPKAAGKTLRDLKIREITGTTIVAVVRDGTEHFSPHAEYELACGDVVLAVGSAEGQKKLQALLQ